MKGNDAEACKLTPCGNPLRATTGRSQASTSMSAPFPDAHVAPCLASELTSPARPQGVEPAQPAGPAGGPVATDVSESFIASRLERAPSSLDTLDTTRRMQEKSAVDTLWLDGLGQATCEHRQAKAHRHREKAKRVRARARNSGACEAEVTQRAKWYTSRARGQEERIVRVKECGSETLVISCQVCEAKHERVQGCRARHYCVRCRAAFAGELRARFLVARADVVREAEVKGLLREVRRGGPYGDKFLTLTCPHDNSDTIVVRIERILSAWARFLRLLNDYLRELRIRHVEWLRVLEWTPGKDLLGHPHLHVWLFAPYLSQERLREWWRSALLVAGGSLGDGVNPIVDIRAVKDPSSGAAELVKYMTKDIDQNGEKIPPELYAQVVIALDAHRQAQASKGFMKRATAKKHACHQCNSPLPKRVRKKRKDPTPGDQANRDEPP